MFLHHCIAITCAFPCAIFETFCGITIISATMEVNSICLHSRSLLKFSGRSRGRSYKVVAICNIVTFVAFRLIVLYGLTLYVWENMAEIGEYWGPMVVFGACATMIMNSVLFYRCVVSDFIKDHDKQLKAQ